MSVLSVLSLITWVVVAIFGLFGQVKVNGRRVTNPLAKLAVTLPMFAMFGTIALVIGFIGVVIMAPILRWIDPSLVPFSF